ncbi:NAD(P)/FAD-dependent oxidoreductase [Tropicibacter oceani]|uniref:FAD-binding oxidoreductase n=1 Tax=Tropicibacter oceani TaxID=3058420 RepID=A0ABY8QFE7_9RHOB|nr:FAD-binding oxidoreductase [Tropicibacter oceani]WGW03315.1 FAD-binding oxidoreductase [Tropicibacter oceani]
MDDLSLWNLSAAEPPLAATSEAPVEGAADVVIIGGGYTGLATALFAAARGMSVQVIEARCIGYGGSGRNVGLVNAGLWVPPDKLVETLGPKVGRRFLDLFGNGPQVVFDLIEKHQIRCEPRREGSIHAAHSAAGLRDLQGRFDAWRRHGAPVDLLDRDEMQDRTGTRLYRGGLLDHRAGKVNPMGYARGLARAALGAGARISTGAPATGLVRQGALWRVTTARGTIEAPQVVLATNAYGGALWPDLDRAYSVIHFFQLATDPMGEASAQVLPGGQGLWDTAPVMTALTRDAEGRVIVGSMGRMIGTPQGGISARWARKRLARLFPDLGALRFTQGWDGRIAMTPDHMPRICHLETGLFAPLGYNGRGITTGTLFGRALAQVLAGAPRESLPLPVTPLQRLRMPGLQSRALDLAFTAHQMIGGV